MTMATIFMLWGNMEISGQGGKQSILPSPAGAIYF
jgi:hypothetical protein